MPESWTGLSLGYILLSRAHKKKQANRFKSIGANVLKINHSINNRYDTNNISTHDNMVLNNCVSINTLMSLFNNEDYKIDSYDVIIIEEIQFFKDAVEFVKECVDKRSKIIIAAGLDGDFNRNIFPVIANLTESIKLKTPIWDASNPRNKNIYFVLNEKIPFNL